MPPDSWIDAAVRQAAERERPDLRALLDMLAGARRTLRDGWREDARLPVSGARARPLDSSR